MTGVDQLVGALSGGNQQKVVLAKWLASEPTVLILDEPTRGIDIGAKVEVHRIISELAASGLGIILISSDLPEVLAMSDRILVLHEGRITAEIPRERATEERVMFAATGNLARRRRVDDRTGARWLRPASPSARLRARGSWLSRHRSSARAQPRRDHVRPRWAGLARGAPVPDVRQPDQRGGPRVDHRGRRGRRGGRRSSPGTSTCRSRRSSGWSRIAVARTPRTPCARCHRSRSLFGIVLGLVLGMVNGVDRDGLQGAVDRRDARDAEHLPRHRLPGRGQPPGPAGGTAARASPTPPPRRSSGSRSSS